MSPHSYILHTATYLLHTSLHSFCSNFLHSSIFYISTHLSTQLSLHISLSTAMSLPSPHLSLPISLSYTHIFLLHTQLSTTHLFLHTSTALSIFLSLIHSYSSSLLSFLCTHLLYIALQSFLFQVSLHSSHYTHLYQQQNSRPK